MDEIICLQENGPEPRLADWVVLQIELVEAVERISVRLVMLVQ
jgi:hypothetical protein